MRTRSMLPRHASWNAAVCVVAVLLGGGFGLPPGVLRDASAQGVGIDRPRLLNRRGDSIDRLHVWIEAIRRHTPGSTDGDVTALAGWNAADLKDLEVEVISLVTLMLDPEKDSFAVEDERFRRVDVLYTRGELQRLRQLARALGGRDPMSTDPRNEEDAVHARTQFVKRAAILQTDVAKAAAGTTTESFTETPATLGSSGIQFSDGRVSGVDRSGDHWAFARALLGLVLPSPSRDEAVRAWYRATARWQLGATRLEWPHFQRAAQLFPDDPVLLYLRGCLHETFGSSLVQSLIASLPATAPQRKIVRSDRAELEQAESLFRRAVAADPMSIDARLRLGRVQALLEKHAPAAGELRHVHEATADPTQRYYASLFLGSTLEQSGQLTDARQAYERAALYFPASRAPRLALSRLATYQGNHGTARAMVEAVLTTPDDVASDPWFSYYTVPGRGANAHLAEAFALLLGAAR